MTSSAARMPSVKCYLSQAMLDRLAPLTDKAGRELGRTVERAAVIRTAMTAWLHRTNALPLPDVGQAIRRAMRMERKSTRRRRLTVRWTEETARCLVDLTFNVRPWLHRAPPPAFEGLLSLREAMARLSAPSPSPLPPQRKSVLVTVYPTPSAQPRNHGSGGADGSRLPLKAPPAATVGSAPIVSQPSNGLFRSIGER
jgi:hypothetical protein